MYILSKIVNVFDLCEAASFVLLDVITNLIFTVVILIKDNDYVSC